MVLRLWRGGNASATGSQTVASSSPESVVPFLAQAGRSRESLRNHRVPWRHVRKSWRVQHFQVWHRCCDTPPRTRVGRAAALGPVELGFEEAMMTVAELARQFLIDAPSDALCDSCLALACG